MPDKPNIVFIMSDDLGSASSFTGTQGVNTPHFDRVAREGMFYSRCYATAPTCAPSRTAIFTGMYPTELNAQHHHSEPDFPDYVKHLAEHLRAGAGYYTANVVKTPDKYPFITIGKRDYCWSRQHDPSIYDGDDYAELSTHQPFFAEFQIFEPHVPHHSLQRYAAEGLGVDPEQVELPPYYPDTTETRRIWARYLCAVQVFDAKVGMVLDMLEGDGLLDDTIVVVLTDHGRDMPRAKCSLYDAGIHVPLAIRIPAKYRPADYAPGTISDRLISGVDIAPTMLSLAGIDPPPFLAGAPFLGSRAQVRPLAFAHRDRVLTHIDRMRAVTDGRYHYIRNYMPNQPAIPAAVLRTDLEVMTDDMALEMLRLRAEGQLTPEQEDVLAEVRPDEQLFDNESDPHQLHNLADDPQYLPILRRMRTALQLWIAQTQDKGFLPEPAEAAQKGAWAVPLWQQVTKGEYDVEDYGVYDLPASPEFAQMFQ
ncbi:sulfatase [Nocardia sp. NPDC046763]|uniref:sulfatase family protein n=1 Tax=Nocardia sp. NPDC046763 TaxID=3155256 RepID=UPI0033C982C7